jgi:hypothetical protein
MGRTGIRSIPHKCDVAVQILPAPLSSKYSRPFSFADLCIAVLLIHGRIIVVVLCIVDRSLALAQAHEVIHHSPSLPACLSSYVDIVLHQVYCDCTFRNFRNWLFPLCSITLTTLSH